MKQSRLKTARRPRRVSVVSETRREEEEEEEEEEDARSLMLLLSGVPVRMMRCATRSEAMPPYRRLSGPALRRWPSSTTRQSHRSTLRKTRALLANASYVARTTCVLSAPFESKSSKSSTILRESASPCERGAHGPSAWVVAQGEEDEDAHCRGRRACLAPTARTRASLRANESVSERAAVKERERDVDAQLPMSELGTSTRKGRAPSFLLRYVRNAMTWPVLPRPCATREGASARFDVDESERTQGTHHLVGEDAAFAEPPATAGRGSKSASIKREAERVRRRTCGGS